VQQLALPDRLKVAVIGTGAIGGYYGARLAHAGHQVHFLARSEFAYLQRHGLTVLSELGDFSLPKIQVYRRVEDLPAVDLVLMTAKATANDELFTAIQPLLASGGAVVLMQNGFGAEERLASLYPEARIFAGLCFICAFRDGPGRVRHAAYGALSLGALPSAAALLPSLAERFAQAGIETEVLANVLEARLRKLVWNIPFNGLAVVLDATTAELASSASSREMIRLLMDEVVSAARAGGVTIPAEFVGKMLKSADSMAAYNPSMRLDYLAGRPMEVEAIYWNTIRWAASFGYQMRACSLLARQLERLAE
jgi:2-dehydropantoate 2-reductase